MEGISRFGNEEGIRPGLDRPHLQRRLVVKYDPIAIRVLDERQCIFNPFFTLLFKEKCIQINGWCTDDCSGSMFMLPMPTKFDESIGEFVFSPLELDTFVELVKHELHQMRRSRSKST